MSVWAEAWDLPHIASPGKKVAYLPLLDYRFGQHTDAFREEGSITVPTSYDRLNEVLYVDPDDHSNDVGSVIHYYMRDVLGTDDKPIPVGSIVAERKPNSLGQKATGTTQISGRGLTSYFLDRVRLQPYDFPANPTVQGSWTFGAPDDGGLLVNGNFETEPLPNGGFELGDLTHWGTTLDDGENLNQASAVVINDPGTAHSGDYYASVFPNTGEAGDSGLTRSLTGLRVGDIITITMRVRAAAGARLRAGVSDTNGGNHTNSYQELGYRWAEVDNAPSGTGSTDGTWQLITLIVKVTASNVELVITWVGGTAILDFDVDSVTLNADFAGLAPWKTIRPINTVLFEWQNIEVDTGIGAARFQVRDQVYVNPYSGLKGMGTNGITQDVSMTVGARYTGSIRVLQESGIDQKYVLVFQRRTILGTLGSPGSSYMMSEVFTVPTGVWTTLEISEIADVEAVSFQLRWAADEDPYTVDPATTFLGPVTFVDNAVLFEGEGTITIGEVWMRMWDDALNFIELTFDETNDSNGDPWDTERAFELTEGQTYGQIAEDFQRVWRYVHRIRFDREDNLYYFDVFNPGYLAEDWTSTDTGTITVGMNVIDGELVSRAPASTVIRVRGQDGAWIQVNDPNLLAAWGVADGLVEAKNVLDDLGLLLAGSTALAVNEEQMVTFETVMTDYGSFVPLRDFGIFHKLMVNMGDQSGVPKTNRIVTSVVVSGKPGQPPDFAVFVNSDAFASTGAAALAEAVRRLLRRLTRDPKPKALAVAAGGGAGVPRIVLGAADASERSLFKSDLVSDGGSDEDMFDIAVNEYIGEVRLTEGTFETGDLTIPTGIHLTGAGIYATALAGVGVITWTGSSGMRFIGLPESGCIG